MPFNNEIRAGASGAQSTEFYSHTIDQSLRLDNASGAYLTIAAASPTATNRKKVAISCWVKRSGISKSGVCTVFWASSAGLMLQFFTADSIYIYDNNAGGYQAYVQPISSVSRLFRDTSAWYHLALIIDTTQSTAADRSKFYVNGSLQAQNSYPSENSDITWHTGSTLRIGSVGDSQDLNGYIAEFISIDGQDVSISDFGQTKDGIWVPKDVSGLTLGNAGFYLPFSQDTTGSPSAFFDQDDNGYLSWTDPSSLYEIGSSDDFTLELFFNPTTAEMSGSSYIAGYYRISGAVGYLIIQTNLNTRNFYLYYGNGQAYTFGTYTAGDVVAGRWHHLAINRASGSLRCFLDGAQVGSTLTSNTQTWDIPEFRVNKGHATSNVTFDGYISNVRLVVGSAVYSDGSSITVPTTTLTNVTNTRILALTTTTLTQDASSNNVTGTANGSGFFSSTVSPFASRNFYEDAGSNNIDFVPTLATSVDVMPDSPTNNFAILNELFLGNSAVILDGGLEVEPGGFSSSLYGTVSTFAIPKDKKIYIEAQCNDQQGNYWTAGFATNTSLLNGPSSNNIGSSGSIMAYNRSVFVNGTEIDYGSSFGLGGLGSGVSKLAAGDVLGCMIDGATGKVWFSRNGTYFQSPSTDNSGSTGDPDGGNNEIGTLTGGTTDDVFFVVSGDGGANDVFVNFGQDTQNVSSANADANDIGTFEYAPPTNYVALCAANLTDPDIGPNKGQQADDNFNTVLYTGDGTSSNSITGVGFQPDWLWIKNRLRSSISHVLVDSVRGIGDNGVNLHTLSSDNDDPEFDQADADGVSSLNADGFTVGYTNSNAFNQSTDSYVAWNWKAGGTAVSNGNGTITSNVSANQDAGFSIVSFTGNSTNPSTIGHGLSQAPEWIIYKSRDATNGTWYVTSDDIGWTHRLKLDTTANTASSTALWNDTAPTNSVFTISSSLNYNGDAIIAYCFHSVEGYSKVGQYKGGGSSLPFIHTGFRPAWVLLKVSSTTNNWFIYDNEREGFNEENDTLSPNENAVEDNTYHLDFVSNGFKIRGTQNAHNQSGQTFIYLAFAEAPQKYSNAR